MNTKTLAEQLAISQSPKGAFPSTINGRGTDWNGFATALVLRALRGLPGKELAQVRERALDFLEYCASSILEGAFSFWPTAERPNWARIPEDADDTAVMALELARYGRLSRKALLRIICKALIPYRVVRVNPPSPLWIMPGAFQTWLAVGRPNVVDCCVNANVVALMAYARAAHLPGYREACATIEVGLSWAETSSPRLAALIPFYPHLQEFHFALTHAVECGAHHLQTSLAKVAASVQEGTIVDAPICGSAYGKTVWHCPSLLLVRQTVRLYTGQGGILASPKTL